jgi:hypothetical protein
MIRQLLRRDPLLSEPGAFIKFTLFGAMLCNGAAAWAAIGAVRRHNALLAPGSLEYAAVAAVTWLLLSILLLVIKATTRCTPLDLALPVPHRIVWRTRVGVTIAACLALPGIAALALLLVNRINRVPGSVTWSALAMMIALIGGAILSVALIQRYRPRECALRLTRGFLLYFAAVTFGILGLILILTAIAPALCALLAVAGFAVLAHTYRTLPPALLLLPTEPDAAPPRAVAAADVGTISGAAGQPTWVTTVRTLYAFEGSLTWAFVLLPFLAIYGILMGLDSSAFAGVQAAWAWFLAVMAAVLPLAHLHRLDPLPLARRRIFPWIALPIVLIPILSYAGTRILAPARRDPLVACRWVELQGQPGRCGIQVSPDLRMASWGGNPPPAVSPTGESHTPTAMPVVRGGRAVAYNPYATPEGSSPEFVAWQLSRALEAAYGVTIPAAALQQRYLTRQPDGRAAWAVPHPDPRQDYPQLTPPIRLNALPVVALIVGLPTLLLLAGLMRPLTNARDEARRRRLSLLLGAGPLVLSVAFLAAAMEDLFDPDSAFVLARAGLERLTGSAWGHPIILWGVVVALLALGYAMAARAFRRLEIPGPVRSWQRA